jgi:putative ABC transport system permease protein
VWKVTRKGLGAHKIRFLLTALSVIIGVAFMTGTSVLSATIQKTFDDLFADIYRGTDAVVRSPEVLKSDFGAGQRPNVPASLVNVVASTPSVDAASGNVSGDNTYAQVVDKHGDAIGGSNAPTFGLGWQPNPTINQFDIVDGRPPRTTDEIAIDKHTAEEGNLSVGDRVTVLTAQPPRKYDIVGIARFGSANSLAGASITLFTMTEAQRIGNSVGQFAEISVVAKDGVSQDDVVRDIRAQLDQEGLGKKYEVLTGEQITKENQDQIKKQLSFFSIGLTAFALIALIVGAFIIYNTFSIVVAQRLREMALLRAIGASRRQVLTSVIGEAAVVGVVASAIGVGVGVGLAFGLKALMAAAGFELPGSGVEVPFGGLVFALIIGTVVTLVSAIVPARQAARIPPIAAMRAVALERPLNRGLRSGIGLAITLLGVLALLAGLFADSGIVFVAIGALLILLGVFVLSPLFARGLALAIGAPLRRFKGVTGNLARENAARNPRRTATTGAAVMIAVSLVGFITIFAASANASISDAIDNQLKTDYIITGPGGNNGPLSGVSPSLGEAIKQLPEIESVARVRLGEIGINDSRTYVNAVDADTADQLLDFDAVQGSFKDIADGGIGISTRKADDNGWKIGSEIPVTFVKTGEKPLEVRFIYDANTFGDYVISLKTYEQNFEQQLDFLILAKLKPGVTAEEGQKALEPIVDKYPTADLKDNAQYKADQKKQVNQVLVLFYVLLLLAVIISLIGIANTMTLSIHERTKELGLLRAVGESRRQTRSMIRWEAVIIALLGTGLGIVIALFFGWAVVEALKDSGFRKFSPALGSLVVIFVAAGFAAVLAALLPARRAARLNVLDAIQHE